VSWLRIDDGFPRHPKLLQLTRSERYTWVELLCYCAEQRTEGGVPESITNAVRQATTDFLCKAHDAGLLDARDDGTYIVHDWALYNGDLAARVAAYCTKYPEMSANDIQKATGGTRDVVLQLVRSNRQAGSHRTTEAVDKRFGPNQGNGHPPGSESGSSPNPTRELPAVSPSRSEVPRARAREAPTDGLTSIDDDVQRQLDELRARDEGMP
jgi:hypothetical protein